MDEKIIWFALVLVVMLFWLFYIRNWYDNLNWKVEKYCSENWFKNIKYDILIGRYNQPFEIKDKWYCYNNKGDGVKLYFDFSR